MNYSEIVLTVMLKDNIHFTKSGCRIGHELHRMMLNDSMLTVLHSEKNVKNISFSNFYPTEKDGFYKSGKVYVLRLRCFDSSVALALKKVIKESKKNLLFTVIATEIKTIKPYQIIAFTSVTPVIVIFRKDNYERCWTPKEKPLLFLQDQLQNNLIKKYEKFTGEKLNMQGKSFVTLFEILNNSPAKIVYENRDKFGRTFLGYKFKIHPDSDELSQKLAFTALACGLGEKNSLIGAGFCLGGRE